MFLKGRGSVRTKPCLPVSPCNMLGLKAGQTLYCSLEMDEETRAESLLSGRVTYGRPHLPPQLQLLAQCQVEATEDHSSVSAIDRTSLKHPLSLAPFAIK